MRLFDSHAHIASERFAGDLPEVLERMRAAGVAACVVVCDPGDDEPDHERALEIVRQNPGFRLAAGMHPHKRPATGRTIWKRRCAGSGRFPNARVLGEIGLDYHYDLSPARQAARGV